jgi:hypothetical protein
MDRERFLWHALLHATPWGSTETNDYYRFDAAGTEWERWLRKPDVHGEVDRDRFLFRRIMPAEKSPLYGSTMISGLVPLGIHGVESIDGRRRRAIEKMHGPYRALKDVIGGDSVILDVDVQTAADIDLAAATIRKALVNLTPTAKLLVPAPKVEFRAGLMQALGSSYQSRVVPVEAHGGFYRGGVFNLDKFLAVAPLARTAKVTVALQGLCKLSEFTWEKYHRSGWRLVLFSEWAEGLAAFEIKSPLELLDIDRRSNVGRNA